MSDVPSPGAAGPVAPFAGRLRGRGSSALVALSLLAASLAARPALAHDACEDLYVNPQRHYPHDTAEPPRQPAALPAGEPLGAVSYRVPGSDGTRTLEGYLGTYCTTAFLVLKDGRLVFERYLEGTDAGDHFLSASMSKTLLALLVGMAVDEGRMRLDERVRDILPGFEESAFADVSVEQLLRMSSGVALVNSYQPGAEADNVETNPIATPRQDVLAYLRGKKQRAAPAGTGFDYNGADSALLGAMLRARWGGGPLTDQLERRLWQPLGAESTAGWIKNRHGDEGVQGQFFAVARDYARLGLLVMNGGRAGDRSLVSSAWIARMTELRRDVPQPSAPPWYGLHAWIPKAAGGRSMFWGTNGQNIFVDPVAGVVIVHLGNSHRAGFEGNADLFALRDAIVQALAARDRVRAAVGASAAASGAVVGR